MMIKGIAGAGYNPGGLDRKTFRRVFSVNFWVQISNLSSSVVCGILISRHLGADSMAAYGLVLQCYYAALAVFMMLAVGGQVLYSSAIGRNDRAAADSIFNASVFFALLVSAVTVVCGFAFADTVSRLLGARGEGARLLGETSLFLKALLLGNVQYCLMTVLPSALQIDGSGRLVRIAGFVQGAVGISGYLLCAFVFRSGLFSFGVVTSLSYTANCAVMLCHFGRKARIFSFSPFSRILGHFRWLAGILANGFSVCVQYASSFLIVTMTYGVFGSVLGAAGLTAYSVRSNIVLFFDAFTNSLYQTSMIFAALAYGERDAFEVKSAFRHSLICILTLIIPASAAVFALAGPIVGLYVSDAGKVAEMSRLLLRSFVFSLPFAAFGVTFVRMQQSMERKLISVALGLAETLVSRAAALILLSRSPWRYAICVSDAVAYLVFTVLIFGLVAVCFFQGKTRGLGAFGAVLLLERGNLAFEGDVLRMRLLCAGDISRFAKMTADFLVSAGFPESLAVRVELAFEGVSAYVMRNFAKGETQKWIDGRVFALDGLVTLRIRDNCGLSDLRERALNWKKGEDSDELGLGMAMKLASGFSYVNSLSLNNETLVFEVE